MAGIKIINFSKRMKPINSFCEMLCEKRYTNQETSAINRVLYIIELDQIGENEEVDAFLRAEMRSHLAEVTTAFKNQYVALIVCAHSELFTKSFAKKFIFLANEMGAEFIGQPLVEITEGYKNFKTWQKVVDASLEQICFEQLDKLIQRLMRYDTLSLDYMNVLVLHAGYKEISNTLMLWDQIEAQIKLLTKDSRLKDIIHVDTLHVEEGKISDCYGCSFETCMYYAREKSCFYGGFVVEDLYPKLEKADVVVWICPNYNDAISAKLMAVINRLTALYRNMGFQEKYILSVVVSGNSGSDAVAKQLIGALSVNKGFRLPPKFAFMATANEPGEIKAVPFIEEQISSYVNSVVELFEKNINKK